MHTCCCLHASPTPRPLPFNDATPRRLQQVGAPHTLGGAPPTPTASLDAGRVLHPFSSFDSSSMHSLGPAAYNTAAYNTGSFSSGSGSFTSAASGISARAAGGSVTLPPAQQAQHALLLQQHQQQLLAAQQAAAMQQAAMPFHPQGQPWGLAGQMQPPRPPASSPPDRQLASSSGQLPAPQGESAPLPQGGNQAQQQQQQWEAVLAQLGHVDPSLVQMGTSL